MFYDVIRWMLQRELLVTLHLRVRIVVPAALKARVHRRWEEMRETGWQTEEEDRFRERGHKARTDTVGSDGDFGLFDSSGWYARRGPGSQSNVANMGEVIGPPILEEGIQLDEELEEEELEEEEEVAPAEAEAAGRMEDSDETEEGYEDRDTSILADPGRATSVQRRWLQAMSEGKDEQVTRRFDQYVAVSRIDNFRADEPVRRINQYFDGKCTDDEILFKAEISRRQLREVLHVYDEYVGASHPEWLAIADLGPQLQTFLLPS
jgi:hypothetical protein